MLEFEILTSKLFAGMLLSHIVLILMIVSGHFLGIYL